MSDALIVLFGCLDQVEVTIILISSSISVTHSVLFSTIVAILITITIAREKKVLVSNKKVLSKRKGEKKKKFPSNEKDNLTLQSYYNDKIAESVYISPL
jgi:hypothetical protein